MKEVTLRKNKSYTAVLVNVVNRKNFLESSRIVSDEKKLRPTVVKPSKQGFESYKKVYKEELLMRQTPVGGNFEIMGVVFKVLDRKENMGVNGDVELECEFYNRYLDRKVSDRFRIFYFQSLIENVYQAVTEGDLLFF